VWICGNAEGEQKKKATRGKKGRLVKGMPAALGDPKFSGPPMTTAGTLNFTSYQRTNA